MAGDDLPFILRLTGLALAYAGFTLAVESSKRPVRKIVDSGDPLGELLSLATQVWEEMHTVAAFFSSGQWRHVPTQAADLVHSSAHPPAGRTLVVRSQSADLRVRAEQPLVNVAVEDLCDSCRNGWVMANELSS